MVLPELIAWLVSDGFGTSGTDLFYGTMPDVPLGPDANVTLYEYGGLPNEPFLGGKTINLEFPSIQAVARGVKDDYDGPRLKLQQLVTSFAKIGDTTISGVKYGCVMAKQPVFWMRRDENFRHYFAVNFHVQKGFSAS